MKTVTEGLRTGTGPSSFFNRPAGFFDNPLPIEFKKNLPTDLQHVVLSNSRQTIRSKTVSRKPDCEHFTPCVAGGFFFFFKTQKTCTRIDFNI